jgi:hypothetical protein
MGRPGAMRLAQFFEAHGLFQIFGGLERQCVRIGEPAFVVGLHREVQIPIGAAAQLVGWHAAIEPKRAAIVGWLFDTTRKFIVVKIRCDSGGL